MLFMCFDNLFRSFGKSEEDIERCIIAGRRIIIIKLVYYYYYYSGTTAHVSFASRLGTVPNASNFGCRVVLYLSQLPLRFHV